VYNSSVKLFSDNPTTVPACSVIQESNSWTLSALTVPEITKSPISSNVRASNFFWSVGLNKA
jgi:hypothetical protein